MPTIKRSALVEHSATRMFALVNDVRAYPRRFDWCRAAEVLEEGEDRLVARLELGLGGFATWFTTENALEPPHAIDMHLRDGPFRRLEGRWRFHAPYSPGPAASTRATHRPTTRTPTWPSRYVHSAPGCATSRPAVCCTTRAPPPAPTPAAG